MPRQLSSYEEALAGAFADFLAGIDKLVRESQTCAELGGDPGYVLQVAMDRAGMPPEAQTFGLMLGSMLGAA